MGRTCTLYTLDYIVWVIVIVKDTELLTACVQFLPPSFFSNLGQWVSEVVWHKADFVHIWPDLIKLHSQQRTCGELSIHKFCLLLPYFCQPFSHYSALVMCEKRPTLILAKDTMLDNVSFPFFFVTNPKKSLTFCSYHLAFTPWQKCWMIFDHFWHGYIRNIPDFCISGVGWVE